MKLYEVTWTRNMALFESARFTRRGAAEKHARGVREQGYAAVVLEVKP